MSLSQRTTENQSFLLSYLFDDSVTFFSAILLSLASGDNTVYTVPSSTTAALVDQTGALSGNTPAIYVNTSGGSRTINWNMVPSGGSPGSTNQTTASSAIGTNGRGSLGFNAPNLGAGDFVNINTDANTATQIAWVNVMEFT